MKSGPHDMSRHDYISRASFDRPCEQEVSQGGDHLVVPHVGQ